METPAHGTGQQLGLVEAADTAAFAGGRQPGDHMRLDLGGREEAGEAIGQPRHGGPGVAVLEPGHDLTGGALVGEQRERRIDIVRHGHPACRPHQRDACEARRSSGATAEWAVRREQHASDGKERV